MQALPKEKVLDFLSPCQMDGSLFHTTFVQTIEGFRQALKAKDVYTFQHSHRVARCALHVAYAMDLSPWSAAHLYHGGLMHDIGKMQLRSEDLNKPRKLTPQEYALIQMHPLLGRQMLEPIACMAPLLPWVYHHHEAWNGSGYPEGLSGTQIPLESRILAVADAYDAMTSDRPYRQALPHQVAVEELKRCAGQQFDPYVVETLLKIL